MTPEIVMELGRQAMEMTLLVSGPLLLAGTGHRPDHQHLSGRDPDQRTDAVLHSETGGDVHYADPCRAVDAADDGRLHPPAVREHSADDRLIGDDQLHHGRTQRLDRRLFFPLARILALVAAPPFQQCRRCRARVAWCSGLAIAIALVPALPPMPAVDPASGIGLMILAQQMVIGFAMGFAMRLVFSAVRHGGQVIGMQMGLGFATFYDPDECLADAGISANFIGLLALLVLFMAINGHLMILATLAQSFSAIPVGAPFAWRPRPGRIWPRRRDHFSPRG